MEGYNRHVVESQYHANRKGKEKAVELEEEERLPSPVGPLHKDDGGDAGSDDEDAPPPLVRSSSPGPKVDRQPEPMRHQFNRPFIHPSSAPRSPQPVMAKPPARFQTRSLGSIANSTYCQYCCLRFTNAVALQRHTRNERDKHPYYCSDCMIDFTNFDIWQHVSRVSVVTCRKRHLLTHIFPTLF